MRIKHLISFAILLLIGSSCQGQTTDFKQVDVTEFQKLALHKDAQLLDVRTPGEFKNGTISKSKNIDWNGADFNKEVQQLDKEKPVLVFCLILLGFILGAPDSSSASSLKLSQDYIVPPYSPNMV